MIASLRRKTVATTATTQIIGQMSALILRRRKEVRSSSPATESHYGSAYLLMKEAKRLTSGARPPIIGVQSAAIGI